MPERVSVGLRLEPGTHAALKEWAAERKRSLNNLIEVILEMAIEENAPEPLTDEIDRRLA